MTTIADLVDSALRKAGLIAESDAASGYQSQRGLSLFNDLMHRLVGQGMTFTDSAGTTITFADMSLSDDFPLAETHRTALKYLLVPDIVDELGGQISEQTARQQRPSYSSLYGAFGVRSAATMDATLTRQVRYY